MHHDQTLETKVTRAFDWALGFEAFAYFLLVGIVARYVLQDAPIEEWAFKSVGYAAVVVPILTCCSYREKRARRAHDAKRIRPA